MFNCTNILSQMFQLDKNFETGKPKMNRTGLFPNCDLEF